VRLDYTTPKQLLYKAQLIRNQTIKLDLVEKLDKMNNLSEKLKHCFNRAQDSNIPVNNSFDQALASK